MGQNNLVDKKDRPCCSAAKVNSKQNFCLWKEEMAIMSVKRGRPGREWSLCWRPGGFCSSLDAETIEAPAAELFI